MQSDSAVQTKYGSSARSTKDTPAESFFESLSDVTAMNVERFNLLKADRRRFMVTVRSILSFGGALSFSQVTPTVTLVDSDAKQSGDCLISSVDSVDFDADETTLILWG